MSTQLNYRGTEINKVHISDVQDALQNKGLSIDVLFGEGDYMFVSNGFLRGLRAEINEVGEWHHYFTKEGAEYTAAKMNF